MIDYIDLVLENCEVIRIQPEDLDGCILDNLSLSARAWNVPAIKYKRHKDHYTDWTDMTLVGDAYLAIKKSALDKQHYWFEEGKHPSDYTEYERLAMNDITHIEVHVKEPMYAVLFHKPIRIGWRKHVFDYTVYWPNGEEDINKCQKTTVSPRRSKDGDVVEIRIRKENV